MPAVTASKAGTAGRSKERPRARSDSSPASIVRDLASGDAKRRAAARVKAIERGSRVAPALIKALDNKDENLRWDAVDLLGAMRDTRATAGVVARVLTDDDVHVRWRAIWASTALDDGSVAATLVSALKDRNATVAWNAAVALSVFGRREAVSKLHSGLKSRIPFQRWEAVNALGSVHDRRTQGLLVRALEQDESDIRREAALSLGRLGDTRFLGRLRKLAKRECSDEVRGNIEEAIQHLTRLSAPGTKRLGD